MDERDGRDWLNPEHVGAVDKVGRTRRNGCGQDAALPRKRLPALGPAVSTATGSHGFVSGRSIPTVFIGNVIY